MKIIDISWPISPEMTAYKDRSVVTVTPTKIFERDAARETTLFLGSHTGTHVDAPAHFLQHGATIDQLPLSVMIGPCTVIDCTDVRDMITDKDLAKHPIEPGSRILCKTRNSQRSPTDRFDSSFIYLDVSAADYLAARKIQAVGIDYLGIERGQPNHDTHSILMQRSIVIIEGLRLAHVAPGNYVLWCLPLAVIGAEAAPARAILIQD